MNVFFFWIKEKNRYGLKKKTKNSSLPVTLSPVKPFLSNKHKQTL
jgi:hypothetical protein